MNRFYAGLSRLCRVAVLSAFALPALAADEGSAGGARELTRPAQDPVSCTKASGAQPKVLVNVDKLQSTEGNLRVQVYSDDPEEFLAKGKKLLRLDVPISSPTMQVCVPLPGLGDYALVVMHDKNSNGRADIFTEGFGFSNNPKLLLAPPDLDETLFAARPGVIEMDVSLTYMIDLEQKKRRTRRRR